MQALSIYDQAKQFNPVCSVQTYTEALDTCAKAKNIAGMIGVLNDMRTAASVPNAVTCTVLLIALSSKCSNNIEVSNLLQSLEGFDSELVQCCQCLLTDNAKTDQEVRYFAGNGCLIESTLFFSNRFHAGFICKLSLVLLSNLIDFMHDEIAGNKHLGQMF